MTETEMQKAAASLVASGFSVIPIGADGKKMPAFDALPRVWSKEESRYKPTWAPYRTRLPTKEELGAWFGNALVRGLAVLTGAASGGLEIIDCDNQAAADRFQAKVSALAPTLLGRLVRVRSPRPGVHLSYRCKEYDGSMKLARVPDPEDPTKPKTAIELKGEGGYCLCPPTPGSCHETGRPYEYLGRRQLTSISEITPDERSLLIQAALDLNQWVDEPRQTPPPSGRSGDRQRPGNDFNARADWRSILEPHGWKCVSRSKTGADLWRRPGKNDGISATTNHCGHDVLYVFSTSAAPFEAGRGYTKFSAYALLNHQGDFSEAARMLSAEGYGGMPLARPRSGHDPYARYKAHARKTRRQQ